ncbi:Transcription factor tau 60 kDa subunit [Nakaseomyces bracarensis]|uniref:Transcription factor tau 60 kDa subunit n=1 Tax=Nakaseomyces bracarensis TaxID=273131 RepID=A0ABR4NXL2_9SACH
MKLVRDLNVNRRDLNDWENGLEWSREGTLVLGTTPEITVAEPIYRRDIERNAKNMFQLRSCELPVEENALEFVQTGLNTLLNSDPASKVRATKPSSVHNLLACLTTNGNCIIFENQLLATNITPTEGTVESRTIHSVCWSPDDQYICLGNECGQLIIYSVHENEGSQRFTFNQERIIDTNIGPNNWITSIIWENCTIICSLLDNSVHRIENFEPAQELKGASRFKINDMKIIHNHLLISTTGTLHSINLSTMNVLQTAFNNYESFHIIPLHHARENNVSAVLISNRNSIKIIIKDTDIIVQDDDIVSPHLEKKVKKWCTLFNEYNKYEVSLFIYGISLSPDGYSVAILFSIDRISLKYRIVSENRFYITFIPLYQSWSLTKSALGLAWYQTYCIYECAAPENLQLNIKSELAQVDKSLPFKKYLDSLMDNEDIIKMQFSNFIQGQSDIRYILEAIYEFCTANKHSILNPLDRACISYISAILEREQPFEEEPFTIRGDHIEEHFSPQDVKDADIVISNENHTWKRCAITFLPLLTTKLKICPVTGRRIIDISNDKLNEYGWLTRTLLETYSSNSPYSGTPFTTTYKN